MMSGYGGWGYGNMMGYGGFGLGWIFMVVFLILIIWAAVAFVRGGKCWDGRCDFKDKMEDNSLKILKERYAKGEISREDFEKIKKDLTD